MYRVIQKIQIGNIGITGCVSTEITKSIDNFTQTAVIVLPNILYREKSEGSFIVNEAQNLQTLIEKNDIVKIWSGYNKTFDELPLRFSGYVVRMEVKENITLYCEDSGYILKCINVPSKSLLKTTVKEVVDYALQGANITVEYQDENTNIGDFIIDNNSIINTVQVLEKLEDLGFKIYFKGTTLKIGVITKSTGETKNFIIQHNVSQDDLIYKEDNDGLLVLKGISNLETNEKIELFAYVKNVDKLVVDKVGIPGEQRTLNAYNKTEAELEELLRKEYYNFYYTGYQGTFTTFLEPYVDLDDTVNLYDLQYQERNGNYKVRSVVTKIDVNGGFQEIELRQKITGLKKIGYGR